MLSLGEGKKDFHGGETKEFCFVAEKKRTA
jgi:hypothetical protein